MPSHNTLFPKRSTHEATLVLALALGLTACGDDDSSGPDDSDQLVVGALLSLTGPGRTLGQTSEAALQLAADDLNAQFSAAGSPTRVSLRIQDTGLDPSVALDRLTALAEEGVRIFIGPQSSSEIAALKSFADANDVVVLSQGSTAGSLSIPNDNVFRLVPDDAEEGAAMVELMREDGIATVVPLWREDAGNQGLHDAVERLFTEAGGTVTAGASYPPGTTDFTAPLAAVRSEIEAAVAEGGAATVAVYFAAFEESAVGIFAAASADPVFSQVRWYGGDGMVQSSLVVADPDAAAFAAATEFRAPTYGLDDQLIQDHADLIDGHRGAERSPGRRVHPRRVRRAAPGDARLRGGGARIDRRLPLGAAPPGRCLHRSDRSDRSQRQWRPRRRGLRLLSGLSRLAGLVESSVGLSGGSRYDRERGGVLRPMVRVPGLMLCGVTVLALSNCTTEACDCPPGIVPAIVTGQVVRDGGTPVAGAIVSAFSDTGVGCESLDIDLGLEVTGADGRFRLRPGHGLPAGERLRTGVRSPSGRSGLRGFRHRPAGDGFQRRAHPGQC